MSQSPPRYLIVGADSMIGSALIARLRQMDAWVLSTTRKPGNVTERCLHLDLADDLRPWRPPQPVDVAILCAGVTGIHDCRSNPAASARINVEGVTRIVRNLQSQGTFVIYLSSNQVFDGSVPFRSPQDAVCPITEYGRQKAEVERRLSEGGAAGAIVRSTRILGPQTALFATWVEAFRRGQCLQPRPYSDRALSAVPLSFMINILLLVAGRRLSGILHVSGDKDITYEAAARLGAKALGADARLVQAVKAAHAGADSEPMPIHTALNIDVLKSTLGIVPPDVEWTIETAFVNPPLLGGLG